MSTAEDPVKTRQAQLKRAQKLQQTITDYINNSDSYFMKLDTQTLRNLHEELTKEQNELNDQIGKLLD